MSAPDKAFLDEIYRRKILHSRKLTPEQRITCALELSDSVARIIRDGVRNQFPNACEDEVQRLFIERVRRVKRLDEQRCVTSPKQP